jgi:hypothetical protein
LVLESFFIRSESGGNKREVREEGKGMEEKKERRILK